MVTNIPPNWSWVKLGDVCNKITDGTHFTPNYTSSGIPFISVKDIYAIRESYVQFFKIPEICKIYLFYNHIFFPRINIGNFL